MNSGEMASLLDLIRAFNRRERHVLVGWVLDRLTFPLGHEFRTALSESIGVSVPADAYVAMDYNLNWLAAALMWSNGKVSETQPRSNDLEDGVEMGDNSDCDLLVAFARGPKTHIVFTGSEGLLAIQQEQAQHKAERLKTIFGEHAEKYGAVVPHWVLVSPKPPQLSDLAAWMLGADQKPRHLPLPQPASHKFALSRCDAVGKRVGNGGHWMIRHDPWPGPVDSP